MPVLGVGLCVSIQFASLESMKRLFTKLNAEKSTLLLSPLQLYLAGAASGIANSVFSGPIEHVRTRLQVQTSLVGGYTGPFDLVKKVYAQYGIRGVYKGQTVTLLREFHGYGVYFATYFAHF